MRSISTFLWLTNHRRQVKQERISSEESNLLQCLSTAIGKIGRCADCGTSITLVESVACSKGLIVKTSVRSPTQAVRSLVMSDPYAEDGNILNTRALISGCLMGGGQLWLISCACMPLPHI